MRYGEVLLKSIVTARIVLDAKDEVHVECLGKNAMGEDGWYSFSKNEGSVMKRYIADSFKGI